MRHQVVDIALLQDCIASIQAVFSVGLDDSLASALGQLPEDQFRGAGLAAAEAACVRKTSLVWYANTFMSGTFLMSDGTFFRGECLVPGIELMVVTVPEGRANGCKGFTGSS